jgi:hypothetical protein
MNSLWIPGASNTVRGVVRSFMLRISGLMACRPAGLAASGYCHVQPGAGLNLVEFMFSLLRFFSASHRFDLGVA